MIPLLFEHSFVVPSGQACVFLPPVWSDMDAQYPFASRDDIWRVFDELKELHATQFEQAERIARLERRRDEDARMKSVWGPLSPFPTSVAGTVPTGAFVVILGEGCFVTSLLTCRCFYRTRFSFTCRRLQRIRPGTTSRWCGEHCGLGD